uniref:Uncharacterized protein n=1 Tax=viral metagenome TaxID=1070528 RepID=A0A6C0APT9_9ZZZZ
MCDHCKQIAPGYAFEHKERCPFQMGLLCNRCARFGHTADTCQIPESEYAHPNYEEQLVPPTYLDKHSITTRNPILSVRPSIPLLRNNISKRSTCGVIEIEDDNIVIRQFLRNRRIPCPRPDTKGAYKRLRDILEAYAKKQNKRVEYGFLKSGL